jgi:hypothetical protein
MPPIGTGDDLDATADPDPGEHDMPVTRITIRDGKTSQTQFCAPAGRT